MCGILATIDSSEKREFPGQLIQNLQARGPDHSGLVSRVVSQSNSKNNIQLDFFSSVLSLRGTDFHCQPATHKNDHSVLCWNGEAWKINGNPIRKNDTEHVLRHLLAITQSENWGRLPTALKRQRICQVMGSINGPFSFVFYDAHGSMVFFGRDKIGRRSLLWQNTGTNGIRLASLSDALDSMEWEEVDPSGMHSIDLQSFESKSGSRLSDLIAFDYWTGDGNQVCKLHAVRAWNPLANPKPTASDELPEFMEDCAPDVLVGHRILLQAMHLRLDNIASQSGTGYKDSSNGMAGTILEKVGILFSGGLDCSILARLANDILPVTQPIALLNVAFENPRISRNIPKPVNQAVKLYEVCPDRITARKSLCQLQLACPGREWKFVAINISYEESLLHRDRITSLMRPHKTEMDISIAMALYFAARGEGLLELESCYQRYKSSARVLISGLGADELFGGYSRHYKCYMDGGVDRLVKELQLDIDRIGQRNLGRDDRVTSTWAKELRYPFLDNQFMDWALRLPLWKKCAFISSSSSSSQAARGGTHGKYILRLIAASLGLGPVADERKRAIQFGSRSAKMLDPKSKGSDDI